MYNCSSSFLLSLPAIDARLVRPTSYSLRRIQHSIITSSWRRRRSHLSIHEITILSSSQACCFGVQDSAFLRKFKFNEKPSGKFVTCVSSSLPSEEEEEEVDSSHLGFLENDSAESPRGGGLIQQVGEDNLINIGLKGFKQTLTRSNLVAKQVISIQSALSLGFISQLWVDTTSVSCLC